MTPMEQLKAMVAGKKVAFIGAGVSHKPCITMLAALGADITLCDQKKSLDDFGDYADTLRKLNVKLSLGEHYTDGFAGQDIIMRTPGYEFFKPELQAAKQAGVYVVAPIALYHDDLPGVPFNSAVLIDREGNVAGVYDKQHLWALERFYFRGGNGTPVFQTDFGTIGIMICYDMGYPEVARMLALQGAQIVLCPSAWCEPDHDVWDINVPARALENTVFLCAVNRYGREQDLYMGGHSKVCDPRGRVVAELPDEGEGVLNVEIDLADVVSNRQTSPYLRDRRPELYGKVLLP